MIHLGTVYKNGEYVVRQGEEGSCMYVVQSGELEVLSEKNGSTMQLRVLKAGDVFGEMALFGKERRSATVRAVGQAQVLTVDKRTLLRRIKDDPLVAMGMMEMLCSRIQALTQCVHRTEEAVPI